MKISAIVHTRVCQHLLLAATVVTFAASGAQAQFSYPGCTDLATADFQTTELFNKTGANSALATNAGLVEPVQFDIHGVMNTAGDSVLYTNIYFVERKGKVKFYNGLTKVVDSIGFIPNWAYQSSNNQNDNGLMGLALDPNFKTNGWIYFWYSPTIPGAPATGASSSANRRLRLSRITVNGQNRLDMATEKIMLDILGSKTDQWHSGGPMTFDRHGDLWVTIGNNSNDLNGNGNQYLTTDSTNSGEWGSSNTASLRGGVIRIRPDNNATAVHTNRSGTYGPGYTIPAGNFGEYWGSHFQSQGNTTLAAEYRDTAKVRPEVYVKGTRSNYSIAIHPTTGWVGWGDVNYQANNDEFNLITNPVFAGMPYFHKNNVATPGGSFVHPVGHSAATPINGSPLNSGVRNLPPASLPVIWHATTSTTNTMPNNVAIGGPFYVYERNLKSSVKFPPHLHNSWILMTAYNQPNSGSLWITMLDSLTPTVRTAPQQQATTGTIRFSIRNPVHAKYGPDGALYVLFYGSTSSYASGNNPGAIRIDYTGNCHLPPVSVRPDYRTNPADLAVQLRRDGIFIRENGTHTLLLHNLAGTLMASRTGSGTAHYSYEALRDGARIEPGIYVVTVRTDRGSFVRQVSLL
jgi:glucose/arabinose dehydrogenase